MPPMVFQSFQSLSPIGLLVDEVEITTDRICISARCRAVEGFCPGCGRRSESVHSHYERRLLDLPSHGRAVQLKVTVRRFRCVHGDCNRRIFAEPVGSGGCPVGGALLGLGKSSAISGLPAAVRRDAGAEVDAAGEQRHFAPRRRRHAPDLAVASLGIDDWAWRRGHRRHHLDWSVAVWLTLPDRPATVEAWLAHHPSLCYRARPRWRIRSSCDEQHRRQYRSPIVGI